MARGRGASPALASGATLTPVTDAECAELDLLRSQFRGPGSPSFFTVPGCDAGQHREEIQAIMMMLMDGRELLAGPHRMDCGCALLIA